jgi:3-phenylpropionate/trans-cinnamate dioxygenase ferredoxin reductase subunit
VTSIDYDGKSVSIDGKDPLPYDKLLIATGAKNRVPNIEGLNAVNYYSLRSKQDYAKIYEALSAPEVKNVTVIGGGFIGMEIASAIKMQFKGANVTVVEGQSAPMTQALGEKIGTVMQRLSEKNGVKVITNAKIRNIEG